jgi:hypothetical protein
MIGPVMSSRSRTPVLSAISAAPCEQPGPASADGAVLRLLQIADWHPDVILEHVSRRNTPRR